MTKATKEEQKSFTRSVWGLAAVIGLGVMFYTMGDDEEIAGDGTGASNSNENVVEVVEVTEEEKAEIEAQEAAEREAREAAEKEEQVMQEAIAEYDRKVDAALFGIGSEIIRFGEILEREDAYITDAWYSAAEESAFTWGFLAEQYEKLELPDGADESYENSHEAFIELMQLNVEAAEVFLDVTEAYDEAKITHGVQLLYDINEQATIVNLAR